MVTHVSLVGDELPGGQPSSADFPPRRLVSASPGRGAIDEFRQANGIGPNNGDAY
jgi:hypothetical protein